MENYKQKVLDLLNSDKIRHLYANTYYSLHDRLDEYGYLEESFLPGRYPGNYTRSSGAYSLMMADFGNLELAERPVRFVLDTMRRFHLNYNPHVVGKLTVLPNGQIKQYCQKFNQIDGTAHILLAYSNLVLNYGVKGLIKDYWDWISEVMDVHLGQPHFCTDDRGIEGRHPSTSIHLFYNPLLEHSREYHFWTCYDLLTQSFMGRALEEFIQIAKNLGEDGKAAEWQRTLDLLKDGIQKNLTMEDDGKVCYAELRTPDGNGGKLFDGISWLNLSPLAARWDPLSREITKNTIESVHKHMWVKDPMSDDIHYLVMQTPTETEQLQWVLGKSIGWDIDACLLTEDYQHIYELLEFIKRYNTEDLFFEFMKYDNEKWNNQDNGNGEQCVWWCTGMGHLRAKLGLPMMPDKADMTIEMPEKKAKR